MHTEAVFEATEGDKTGGGVLASPTARENQSLLVIDTGRLRTTYQRQYCTNKVMVAMVSMPGAVLWWGAHKALGG